MGGRSRQTRSHCRPGELIDNRRTRHEVNHQLSGRRTLPSTSSGPNSGMTRATTVIPLHSLFGE